MLHLLWVVRWKGINNSFRGFSNPMPFTEAIALVSNPKNSRVIAEYWIEPVVPELKETHMHDNTAQPSQPTDWQTMMVNLTKLCRGGFPKLVRDETDRFDGRAKRLIVGQEVRRSRSRGGDNV